MSAAGRDARCELGLQRCEVCGLLSRPADAATKRDTARAAARRSTFRKPAEPPAHLGLPDRRGGLLRARPTCCPCCTTTTAAGSEIGHDPPGRGAALVADRLAARR